MLFFLTKNKVSTINVEIATTIKWISIVRVEEIIDFKANKNYITLLYLLNNIINKYNE